MPLIQQSGSVAIGTPIGSGTSGSVVFIDSSGNLAQDNTNLRFDDAANSLTLGGNLLFTTNDVSTIGVTGTRPNKVWVGTGGINSLGSVVISDGVTTETHSFLSTTYRISGAVGIQLNASSSLQFYTASHRFYNNAGGAGLEGIPGASSYVWNTTACGNTIEQRNGANAQTFNIYGSYTDGSNYTRLRTYFSGDIFYITSEKLGTPNTPQMYVASSSSLNLYAGAGQTINFGIGGSPYVRMSTTAFYPFITETVDSGRTGERWTKGWFGTGGIDLTGSINFTTSGLTIGHSTSVLWRFLNTANISLMNSSTERMRFGGSGIELNSGHYLGWNSTGSPTGSPDLILLRGGAGILEQRNGTNTQTFNVYDSYTDGSNYARAQFIFSGGYFYINSQKAGTGVNSGMYLNSAGQLYYGAANGAAHIWYIAATGYMQLVNLSGTYALKPVSDGGTDLGATALRWNKGWFGSGGLDTTGLIGTTNNISIGSAFAVIWSTRSRIYSNSDGNLRFSNNAQTAGLDLTVSATSAVWGGTGGIYGNTIEQRNGANAQTLNIYRTYTDVSNAAYAKLHFNSNDFVIQSVGVGTGTAGNVRLDSGAGLGVQIAVGGSVRYLLDGNDFTPGVNDARGIGTTSLRFNKGWFGTGGINTQGDITPNASATNDLGGNITRWRVGYFNQLSVGYVANTTALTLAGTNLDAANAQSLISISQTWNTTGSPTGFLANFTNTASGASTNLFDWQLGGVSVLKLAKAGVLSLVNGGETLTVGGASITSTNGSFTISSSAAALLWGSNALIQRRTTNPQTYQLTRTYTDPSNYALLEQTWSGNNALIRTVGLGTGTVGDLLLAAGSKTLTLFNSTGALDVPGSVSIPSANQFVISSRLRLMSSADGFLNLYNNASTGFTRFTLGPESVNFPSLKVNSGVGVEIKTGNDATFMDIKTMSHTFDGSTPGALVDGMIWFDGTDLKIRVSGVTYTLTKT